MYKYRNFTIIICFLLIFVSLISCKSNKESKDSVASPTLLTEPPTTNTFVPSTPSSSITTQTLSPTNIPTPQQTQSPSPTPSQSQDNDVITFSHTSGYYNNEFDFTINGSDNFAIYYTLDGSIPDTDSTIYSGPIKIQNTGSSVGAYDGVTVLRIAAFSNNMQTKETWDFTFLVNKDFSSYNDRYGNMAVISISTDKNNLYGDTGIFTNYTEHGRESERPIHIELFDKNGASAFSINAGMRVYGGTSRANPQKSLKIVARKEYDSTNGKFKYAIFPDIKDVSGETIDRYDSFILRAGGNDCLFGGSIQTLLRDALIHSLAIPISNIAQQASRPAVVYINGDYFGIYNIREDLDNDYIEQHYNIPKDEVAIIAYGHENGNWFYKIDEGTQEDLNDYVNTLSYIVNYDMTNEAYYNEAAKRLDFDNFIKYIGINVYCNNRDWPHNNIRAWSHNGQWHFMLKDIDYSWGIYHIPGAAENVVAEETTHSRNVLTGAGGSDISKAFASLMKNDDFKNRFLNFMDEMVSNYFSTEAANNLINNMVENMEDEFDRYASTFWYTNPEDISTGQKIEYDKEKWQEAIKTLHEYATKRPGVIKNLLNELYG